MRPGCQPLVTLKHEDTSASHHWAIGFEVGASMSISPTSGQRSLPLGVALLLGIASLAVAAIAGCTGQSINQLVAADGLPSAALAHLGRDRAVAAKRDGDLVQVIEYRQEGSAWVRQVLATSQIADAEASLDLLSLGGDTGDEWNTWIYGAAPEEASRVEVTGFDGEGGRVIDGAWVLVLRQRDLTPADIEWRFLDPLGTVLESGTGIFPPAP